MLNYKKFTVFMLLFFLVSTIFTTPITHASGSSVNIKINASTHANLYYEILYNGNRIDKDIDFDLFNGNGKQIATYKTNNGILLIKKVPFGRYTLKPKGYSNVFRIDVNREYLKTQHVLKPLELKLSIFSQLDKSEIDNPQTGDDSFPFIYLVIFIISGLFLMLIVLCKARSEQHEPKKHK